MNSCARIAAALSVALVLPLAGLSSPVDAANRRPIRDVRFTLEVLPGTTCGVPLLRATVENRGLGFVIPPDMGWAVTNRPLIELELQVVRTSSGEWIAPEYYEAWESEIEAADFRLLQHDESIGRLIWLEAPVWGHYILRPGMYKVTARARIDTRSFLDHFPRLRREVKRRLDFYSSMPAIVDLVTPSATVRFEVRECGQSR